VHDPLDRLTLDDAQVRRLGRHRRRRPLGVERQMLSRNETALAEDRGTLERVAELAHIPGPYVPQQGGLRILGEAGWRATERLADLLQEGVAQD